MTEYQYNGEGPPGRYELLGDAKGAGPLRGFKVKVYRCLESGQLYVRLPDDFDVRMKPIEPKPDMQWLRVD